jgi:cytochrome c oxidase assembly protein subunit 11
MVDPRQDVKAQARRNRRVMIGAFAVVFSMVGMSFAAVPLYDLFCRVTGFGGTTQVADQIATEVRDRTVDVRFNADSAPELDWEFTVETREIAVQVGEPQLVYYRARNTSDRPIAATAVYNVTPHRTGVYFQKVQCFCFEEQILLPGEEAEFPVYFFVDAGFDDDRAMESVSTITLSYTFYPTESEALDEATEDYYQSIEESDRPTADAGAADPTGQPAGLATASADGAGQG